MKNKMALSRIAKLQGDGLRVFQLLWFSKEDIEEHCLIVLRTSSVLEFFIQPVEVIMHLRIQLILC